MANINSPHTMSTGLYDEDFGDEYVKLFVPAYDVARFCATLGITGDYARLYAYLAMPNGIISRGNVIEAWASRGLTEDEFIKVL